MKKIVIYIFIVVIVLICSFRLFIFINKNKEQIPVIMYHDVVLDEYYDPEKSDTISISLLEENLKYLKENDYKTISLDEFYCWKQNKCKLPKKSVLLTFDDGFYSFHYLVEPLLIKYNMYAVNFVIGNTVGEVTEKYNPVKYGTIGLDLINNHPENVEYQSHSYNMHIDVNGTHRIYTMTKEEMLNDIESMNKLYSFEYMSYPFNTENDEFIELLSSNGYKLAFRGESEKATKSCNNYQIPRIGSKKNMEDFKEIFETEKYNNRYGNGLLRKIFVTLERKFKIRLG